MGDKYLSPTKQIARNTPNSSAFLLEFIFKKCISLNIYSLKNTNATCRAAGGEPWFNFSFCGSLQRFGVFSSFSGMLAFMAV